MLLKLANTEMHMWDNNNCARGRELTLTGVTEQLFFSYFGDYLNICHFYSKSFQEHLLIIYDILQLLELSDYLQTC